MKNINFEMYKNRPSIDAIEESKLTFINNQFIKPGMSILDIGGATGRFLESINRNICPIEGTVWDTDEDCLEYGRKQFPHINLYHNHFPHNNGKKYDIVMMWGLMPQMPIWKECIRTMAKLSKKYIIFPAMHTLDRASIVDNDVSYVYYLNTGVRNYQTILNFYEFVNFLCTHEIRAKRILGMLNFGADEMKLGESLDYYRSTITHAHRGTPFFKYLNAQWCVEVFSEEENPPRMGGVGQEHLSEISEEDYNFFMPFIQVMFRDDIFLQTSEDKKTMI